MTRRANEPSEPNKGAPTAPPPPSPWRHLLWLFAAPIFVVLVFVRPITSSKPTSPERGTGESR